MKLPVDRLALVLFLLCAPLGAVYASKATLAVRDVSLEGFSVLDVRNPINVSISTAATTPSLKIIGDTRSVSAVTWHIKNGVLYLGSRWSYWLHPGDRLSVRLSVLPAQLSQIHFSGRGSLRGRGLSGSLVLTASGSGCIALCANKLNLSSLVVNGETNITLRHIKSKDLVITGRNDGEIVIKGQAGLQTIRLTGDGSLKVYGVDAPQLVIRASKAERLFLSGAVQNLDVQLSEQARLFAASLRVHTGFVVARNQAHAEVTVLSSLSALAMDDSMISYAAHGADFLSAYTRDQGLVLRR